jgi:hypothetical protein
MVTISFLVLDGPVPLEGAQVRLWSEDGSVFVTQGVTDANGEIVFDVPEDRYSVRCFKTGFAFQSRLQILAEDGALFQLEAQNLNTYPPSTATHSCRATGFVMDATGAPLEGATFEFRLTDFGKIAAGRFSASPKVIVLSDPSAKVDVHLLRNAVYDLTVESLEDLVFRVKVPDSSAVDITELIWPRISTFAWEETSVTLDVGELVAVAGSPVLSNGNTLPYELDNKDTVSLEKLVTAVSSDRDIAAARIVGNELHITGAAVGSADISFEPIDGALFPRLDQELIPNTIITVVVA